MPPPCSALIAVTAVLEKQPRNARTGLIGHRDGAQDVGQHVVEGLVLDRSQHGRRQLRRPRGAPGRPSALPGPAALRAGVFHALGTLLEAQRTFGINQTLEVVLDGPQPRCGGCQPVWLPGPTGNGRQSGALAVDRLVIEAPKPTRAQRISGFCREPPQLTTAARGPTPACRELRAPNGVQVRIHPLSRSGGQQDKDTP